MSTHMSLPSLEELWLHDPAKYTDRYQGDVVGTEITGEFSKSTRFSRLAIELHEMRGGYVLDTGDYLDLSTPGVVFTIREIDGDHHMSTALTPHVSGYLKMHRSLARHYSVVVLQIAATSTRSEAQVWSMLQLVHQEYWAASAGRDHSLDLEIEATDCSTPQIAQLGLRSLGYEYRSGKLKIGTDQIPPSQDVSESAAGPVAVENESLISLEVANEPDVIDWDSIFDELGIGSAESGESGSKEDELRADPPVVTDPMARNALVGVPENSINPASSQNPLAKPNPQFQLSRLWGHKYLPQWKSVEAYDPEPVQVPSDLGRLLLKFDKPSDIPSSGRLMIGGLANVEFADGGFVLLRGSVCARALPTNSAVGEVRRFQDSLVQAGCAQSVAGSIEIVRPIILPNIHAVASLVHGYITSIFETTE